MSETLRRVSPLVILVIVLIASTGRAGAQGSNGVLLATIVNASGAPVSGATVTISVNGEGQTAVSDGIGNVRFPNVPPGPYTVSATAPTYEPGQARGEVKPGGATRVIIMLGLA